VESLSVDRLSDDIRRAGLRAGDAVLVHSSLKGIGRLPNGPQDLVRAFQDVLTDAGTLVMPAFVYDRGAGTARQSDPPATGLLGTTFVGMPGVVRSWHPTHAVCAWGRGAEELCAGHGAAEPFGVGSPLHKLMERDGNVLLLGVGFVTCSMIHVCESVVGMPYLHIPYQPSRRAHVPFVTPDGDDIDVAIREFPACDAAFGVVEKDLRRRGAIQDGMVGKKFTLLCRARALCEVVRTLVRDDPAALLCTNPGCTCCIRRREALEKG
jgi:aminoglycoside 3-N-acetyltransferase